MKYYITMLAVLAFVGCSNPTAPSRVMPIKAHLDVGGSTSPADPGSCSPNSGASAGQLKHCSPGQAPGSSNSPGNS